MSLPDLAIRYRTVTVTLVTLLMAWGVAAYFTMPRREDPEFTVRTCAVTVIWQGAPVAQIEELITDKLEEAIDSIEEVEEIRSTTTVGRTTIFVDADQDMDPDLIDQVWDEVRAKVQAVTMPAAGIKPQVNVGFGDTSILVLAIYQKPARPAGDRFRYTPRQLEIYADVVRDAIRLLPGVAATQKYGVQNEAIYIEAGAGRWSQLDLTTKHLQQLVAARNIVSSGGQIETAVGRFAVKPGGELDAVDEINSIVVAATQSEQGGNQVYLRDLGLDVTRGLEDPPQYYCRFTDTEGSHPAVMLGLTMKSGANIVDVCTLAKQRVRRLVEVEQSLPSDLLVTPVSDQSENVTAKIQEVFGNVIGAIVIVIVIVYLLVGFRSAAVMAANIPVVVLASLAIVSLFDVQLEQISLASIIIALGLLVDNAVQVCDQSRTNQLAGAAPIEATVSGANVLALPMLNGSATTIAAFLPMLFTLSGAKQEYIYSLPVTVSATLAISWILAMTFCVVLAASFIRRPKLPGPASPLQRLAAWIGRLGRRRRKHPTREKSAGVVERCYGRLADSAIRFKFLTVFISVVLLLLAINLPIGSEFFPQDWRDQFYVEIWLPESATIAETNQVASEVESVIRRLSETSDADGAPFQRLRAMRTMVGGGGARWYLSRSPEAPAPNYAELLVRTTDGRFTSKFARQLRAAFERGDPTLGIRPITAARVVPGELFLGPPAKPLELRVVGEGFADAHRLRAIAAKVEAIVADQPETWNVHNDWGALGNQLDIDIDADRANLSGVSNEDVATTLNAYYSGHRLTTFYEGDHQAPVYFRLKPEQCARLADISETFVEGADGKIPLNAVASFRIVRQPARIERLDMNRVIHVRADVEPGVQGNDVVRRVMSSDEMRRVMQDLPVGHSIEIGGSLEESAEAGQEFAVSFGISIVLICLLLVLQYNSIVKPLVILATLPLALIGALPGLYLTNNALGFMPQLGILSLFGIVLNTGIIFVEFSDILIREKALRSGGEGPIVGLSRQEFRECLVAAGKQRMLPIFLTTATTVGGLLPLALTAGPLWEGMAWAMICGLLAATALTLLVVPALYAILVETFHVKPVQLNLTSSTSPSA